jgi:hypothetical protein
VSLAVAVALAVVLGLGRGGSSPSAVGPVVFRGSVALTGEFHSHETYVDDVTAKNVSSCTQAATHGDHPQTGPGTWVVPTPHGTVSMTVDADGSGHVTFTDAPGDDDSPYPGWHGGTSGTIAWTCAS